MPVFLFTVPFNIPLCILVLAVCTTFLSHYWRNRGTLTNTLFLLITAADLITCVGHLILMIFVVLLSYKVVPPTYAIACAVIHTTLSLLGYASSVLLNMILAVLRTVKISFPFHQVNVGTLNIAIALFSGFLVLLCVGDIWYIVKYESFFNTFPWVVLWVNAELAFVGHNLTDLLSGIIGEVYRLPWNQFILISRYQVGLLYLAPIGVVLFCLLTQCLVTRSRVRDPDHPVMTNWSRVNTTVSILSAVFLVCNSGIAVIIISYKEPSGLDVDDSFALLVCKLMISTTLPLLHALLTPLVILARSRELRGNIMMMIRRAVRASP